MKDGKAAETGALAGTGIAGEVAVEGEEEEEGDGGAGIFLDGRGMRSRVS